MVVYQYANQYMKLQIEHDFETIYDLYVTDDQISILLTDTSDELVVSPDAKATVYELTPYVIEDLADLFAALKKRDTVVIDNGEGLIYDGELSNKPLDDPDWFEYCGNSYLLNELIFNDCICKQSKPKELTYKQIKEKYYND